MIPAVCEKAREGKGLALADGSPIPAEASQHASGCESCTKAFARMDRIWQVAGDELPSLRPEADLAEVARGALAEGRPSRAIPTLLLPLRTRRSRLPRHELAGFAAAVSMAALVALVAIVGPSFTVPVPSPKLALEPVRPPKVTLAGARGTVTLVPADGTVLSAVHPGDTLPPGLFSASEGAALSIEGQGLLAVRGDATVLIGGAAGAPDLSVARGEIFVDLPKGTIRTFVVHTPTGSVNVTGTQFGVKVSGTGTQVEVSRGTVIVKSPQGEEAVAAGEAARLGPATAPAKVVASDPAADPLSWVRDLAPERVAPAPVVAIRTTTRPKANHPAGVAVVPEVELPGLDRTVVETAMEKREASMRHCYEQELIREPGLVLHAALHFKIDGDGRAKNLTVSGIDSRQGLSACLVQAAAVAVFPATAEGTEVDVVFPVRFEPEPEIAPLP